MARTATDGRDKADKAGHDGETGLHALMSAPMTRIAVSRLELEVDRAESVTSARFRLEEALRLGVDDDGVRVLLVRRLALGHLPLQPRGAGDWTAHVETRMRGFASRAVHALSPVAAQSEAVYFRSELEARTVLAALLAAGMQPIGWFWRLAIPVWSGGTWIESAPALLHDLLARPGGKLAFAGDGTAAALLAPLTEPIVQALWPELATRDAAPEPTGDGWRDDAPSSPASIVARRVLAALPRPALLAFRRLVSPLEARPLLRRLLATAVVLTHAQHGLAAPRVLAAAVDAVLAMAVPPVPSAELATRNAGGTAPGSAAYERYAAATDRSAPRFDAASGEGAAVPAISSPPLVASTESSPGQAPPVARSSDPVLACVWDERRCEAAGLFLLVGPLTRLGFAAWLERHPEEVAGNVAWALMRDIARHVRVAEEDQLWSLLSETDSRGDTGWLAPWRAALDGWLRRRTRCSLADVVRRSGWLSGDESAIVARFPLDAADIRLRRHALDVDPGWVPWLGRSVTFLYRDRLAA
jgi:hypothetical protein